jgi:signal peptidase I
LRGPPAKGNFAPGSRETTMLKDLSHEFVQGLLLKKDPTALSEARHGIIRRNVEGFATAILYALLLKQFAVDTFQVPTESMEPAIIGRGGMGDRLLVDRLEYLSGDPARYDIVVFKYPLSRLVNYVKRAVGLPGERVVIWRGQIFAAPNHGEDVKCTRKPDGVQEAIFASQPVVAKDETEDFTSMKFFKNWQANGFTPEWRDGRTRVPRRRIRNGSSRTSSRSRTRARTPTRKRRRARAAGRRPAATCGSTSRCARRPGRRPCCST